MLVQYTLNIWEKVKKTFLCTQTDFILESNKYLISNIKIINRYCKMDRWVPISQLIIKGV